MMGRLREQRDLRVDELESQDRTHAAQHVRGNGCASRGVALKSPLSFESRILGG